jgi:hypothetical protein
MLPKSRFRKLSLRVKRSNLALFDEIATELLGARNNRPAEGFDSLKWNLGVTSPLLDHRTYENVPSFQWLEPKIA